MTREIDPSLAFCSLCIEQGLTNEKMAFISSAYHGAQVDFSSFPRLITTRCLLTLLLLLLLIIGLLLVQCYWYCYLSAITYKLLGLVPFE